MSDSLIGSSGTPAVRLWKIRNEQLTEVEKPTLDFEERLENWIASDISIIASNLLVIGRQVETDYGGARACVGLSAHSHTRACKRNLL